MPGLSTIITLPRLYFSYGASAASPREQLLMVTGGTAPSQKYLQELSLSSAAVWSIDHGVDACMQAEIAPERLMGDGDSANPHAWKWALNNGAKVRNFIPAKDFTDTQAALSEAALHDYFVVLSGALGGRMDHTFSTLFTFGEYYRTEQVQGCIADERETVIFLKGGEQVNVQFNGDSTDSCLQASLDTRPHHSLPKAISLLPLSSECSGVSTKGLRWELKDATLSQRMPYAVSNELKGHWVTPVGETADSSRASLEDRAVNSFSVKVNSGLLAIYICWSE